MLTNEIRNQIDQIWNAFWSGGISNPLEVIEQITYLLFIKRLDELQTLEELKATRLKKPIERRLFPEGNDDHPRSPRPYEDYRCRAFEIFHLPTCTTWLASMCFRSFEHWAATSPRMRII